MNATTPHDEGGWWEASGLPHIFRTLGLAVQPAKLGVALLAIVATFLFGALMDAVWHSGGGVEEHAVTRYIQARELEQPYQEAKGDFGIFQVWRDHERRCILGLLGSSVPGASVAAGTSVGTYMQAHSSARPLRNLAGMVYGVLWLFQYHPAFFILFGLGALLIWSLAGGAICRLAAIQFARDEKQTAGTALRYARQKLFGGFFLAPCLPLILIVIASVLLTLGGMLLRVPILGDLIGGLAFPLALIGGFVIALLLVGLFVGGGLFWPCVAVEGSDAFDAFSRGLSYSFTKPWKWILYAIFSLVYAGVCWVFVNLFTFLMLTITRGIVAFGTSPFGLWSRGPEGHPTSKLELLWPLGGPNSLYLPPDWSQLNWYEYFSAVWIGFFVLLVIALMWSFLASFYFSTGTVMYFLLRRDVDGTDLGEVYLEEDESDEGEPHTSAGAARSPSPTEAGTPESSSAEKVSLPVIQSASAPPTGDAPSMDAEAPQDASSETDSTADAGDTERV